MRSIETNATTSEQTAEFRVDRIVALINDGTDDVIFGIDGSTTGSAALTIKAGESLLDIDKEVATLHYRAASGTQAFRAWGIP